MAALANSKYQYVDSTAWGNIAAWAASTLYTAGTLIRQNATPLLGSERVFVCTAVTGVTGLTEPTWVVTKGGLTTDNLVTWQECTGQPGINGSTAKSPIWGASLTVALGQIIYDSVTGSLQICSVPGTAKSGVQPSFSATAGVTTTDNTVTWTSLGLASGFGAFAAPHKRVANGDASTWAAAGSVILIGDDHSETQTVSLTLGGGVGTIAIPNQYLCVSHLTADPTSCTTGATVATTGASALSVTGAGYYSGITISCAGGGSNAASMAIASALAAQAIYLENCQLTMATTSAAVSILFGNSNPTSESIIADLLNCTFVFGATGQTIKPEAGGNVTIRGGSMAATGSVPTSLITLVAPAISQSFVLRDCDISPITGTLIALGSSIASSSTVVIENCKLGVAVTMTSGTFAGPGGAAFKLHNCDSGSKNYRFYESNYLGTIQQETTIIDNTTKATDGTTQISWNITTNANTHFGAPYISPEIEIWNNGTGSSLTAFMQIAGANTLTNGDIWVEFEYLGNASFPIGSTISSRVTDALTSTANVSTSTDSWGSSPANTQQMSCTFTPNMKGWIKARVFVAKPSITVYISPTISISGLITTNQYLIPGQGYLNGPNVSGGSSILYLSGMTGGCDG